MLKGMAEPTLCGPLFAQKPAVVLVVVLMAASALASLGPGSVAAARLPEAPGATHPLLTSLVPAPSSGDLAGPGAASPAAKAGGGIGPSCTGCRIGNISTGGDPVGVAYDSSNGRVLVAVDSTAPCCAVGGNLTAINGTLQQVSGSVSVGDQPYGVAVDPSNGHVFVANRASNDVWVLNGSTDAVLAKVATGVRPNALAYDPVNGMVYVANAGGGGAGSTVSVINASTDTLLTTVGGFLGADGVAVDPHSGLVFVSNGGTSNMTVLNDSTDLAMAHVPVGSNPAGLAYDAFNDRIYVANQGSVNLSVVNATSLKEWGSVSVTNLPFGLASDPSTGAIAETSLMGSVDIINGTTGLVVSAMQFPTGIPMGVAWDGAVGAFFVAENRSGEVTLISPGSYTSILASVTVNPNGVILSPTGSQSFTATTTCVGGPCPGPVTYIWSMNTSKDGSLNTTVGSVVNFTAGPVDGYVLVYVNAYVGGETLRSSEVEVQIFGSSSDLGQISINPAFVQLGAGNSTTFTVSCLAACPLGTLFTWTVSNTTLGTYWGGSTQGGYTAGAYPGNLTMNVTAAYQGLVRHAHAAIEILPLTFHLTSVVVAPDMAVLAEGTARAFSATATCSNGLTCPYTLMNYSWTLSNTLGTLRSGWNYTVGNTFTAGASTGQDTLFLNASMAGVKVASTPVPITIVTGPLPTLLSLNLTPLASTIITGGRQALVAVPVCSSACPIGDIAYSWSMSAAGWGTLNSSSGPTATFTAGSNAYSTGFQVYVEATLGTSSSSNASSITIYPSNYLTLMGVSVQPYQVSVIPGGTVNLTAQPQCLYRFSCGPGEGIVYYWSVSNGLGTIDYTTTPNAYVLFTAGPTAGSETVFVNASQYGMFYVGGPGTVDITTSAVVVRSVVIRPSAVEVKPGGAQLFSANVTCSQTCPTGLTPTWALQGSDGHINPQLNPMNEAFDAGPTPGSDVLTVQVNLGGVTRTGWANITVGNGTLPVTGGGSSPGQLGVLVYVALAIAVVAVLAVVVLLVRRKKNTPGALEPPAAPSAPTTPSTSPTPPDPSAPPVTPPPAPPTLPP